MRITDVELMDLAGPGAFERGYDYYQQGLVGELESGGGKTVALVSGTQVYRVELVHDGVEGPMVPLLILGRFKVSPIIPDYMMQQ